MHKTEAAGHIGNMFVEEDTGIARPPTQVTEDMLNAFMMELVHVATMNGEALLTPGTDTFTQCRDAIITKIQSAINNGATTLIVRAATTTAINLAAPGATIDGVTMVAGDVFLDKDNATAALRGPYIWNGAAVPATRDPRMDTGAELKAGVLFVVTEGTAYPGNADSIFEISNDGTITVGTTPLSIIRKDYQQPQSQSHFSTVINGDCRVATKAPPAISTSGQYGNVDMFAAWATGTAVSAGTITQDTASPIGDAGTALHLSGVTVTGSGVVYTQYRQKGEDSKSFKNKKASFGVLVHHDVGSSINYTITIKKATALDNFGATTTIATSSAQSVPTGTGTLVKFENVDMGDCSNGWSMEVSAACGAVTTKNFRFTEFRAVRGGSLPTDMLPRLLSDDRAACREFCRMINPFTAGSGDIFHAGRALTTSTFRGVFRLDPPMRVAPAVTVVGTNSNFAGEYGNGSIVSATATPTLFSSDRNAVEINFACAANLTAQTPVTVKAAGNAQILLESQL